jgi:hypothetical protein
VLAGVGHFPRREAPDLVLRELLDVLVTAR